MNITKEIASKVADDFIVTLKSEGYSVVKTSLLEELEADSEFLLALEGAGVDNWDGYEIAQEAMEEQS